MVLVATCPERPSNPPSAPARLQIQGIKTRTHPLEAGARLATVQQRSPILQLDWKANGPGLG